MLLLRVFFFRTTPTTSNLMPIYRSNSSGNSTQANPHARYYHLMPDININPIRPSGSTHGACGQKCQGVLPPAGASDLNSPTDWEWGVAEVVSGLLQQFSLHNLGSVWGELQFLALRKTRKQQPATNNRQPAHNNQQPTANNQQPKFNISSTTVQTGTKLGW